MVQVFLKLFNMSVSAGWVILAVLALRLLLKKAPKNFRLALWAVAAFRLICPLTIESVLSLIPSTETVPAEAFWLQTPEVDTGVNALNSVINPILETTMATEEFSSAPPMFLLFYFFSYLWLAGLAAMGIYGIASYLILRRKVAVSVPVRENIRICDSIPTPFILGYLKPKIYLPSHLPPERWEPVIAHEQAHLKRRDHWVKLLGFALLCVYWFQPLVWVAYILLCRDIELACDERVIRDMDPAQKKGYSEALLACGIRQHSLSASPLAFGEVGVKTRIKAVLDYKKPRFWIVIAAVTVCIVVAVCFLTDPLEKPKESIPQNDMMSATIVHSVPSGLAFEENCFYADGMDGNLYRVFWTDMDGLYEGQIVTITYHTKTALEYPNGYPDGGWTPLYEITASKVEPGSY